MTLCKFVPKTFFRIIMGVAFCFWFYSSLLAQGQLDSLGETTLPRSGFLEIFGSGLDSSGEVLIDQKLDLSNAVDLSFLVHEYVHLHQTENGPLEDVECLGLLEAEAYALQAAFLRTRGFPREALMFDLVGQLQGGCAIKY